MLETVHDWFEAVSHPLIHLGPLLSDAPVLIDRIGGGSRPQRTEGVEAIEVRLAELHQRHALLDRPLTAVDMRLPDRLVLRQPPAPEPSANPARRQQGNTRG